MKFKITKTELDRMSDFFKKNAVAEIELEPVDTTAAIAIRENAIRQEGFHMGYHYGYREGYHDGDRFSRRIMGCSCAEDKKFCEERDCRFK